MSIYDDLKKIVKPGAVTDKSELLEEYSGKRGPHPQQIPSSVVWPISSQEVVEIVSWANEKNISLVPVSSTGPRIRGDSAPKVENSVTDVSDNLEVYIPTDEIDLSTIIGKLSKQKEKLEKEIMKLSGMLNNEKFVANAPEQVITENRKALEDAEAKMQKVEAELSGFGV